MTPSTESFSPTQRRAAILLLALAAFWPTLRLGFLWDDHVMIEMNPALREWSTANLRHDFTTDVFDGHGDGYYRPAQTLANRIDYSFWGLRPFGYHLTNLLFHAAAGILVGELVVALGLGALAALLAGCLFAVHPIGVEQLMIIAGRAELMSFAFLLASLLCFLQEGPLFLAAGSAAYIAALFSKESAVITPVLFALTVWFLRARRAWLARLGWYAALTALFLAARFMAVGSPVPPMPAVTIAKFFIMAFPKIMAIYVRLLLVPWNLHSHRMVPHLSHFWSLYAAGWIAAAAWLARTKNRLGLYCLAWFVLALLPKTPAMFIGNFTLDHWAYAAAPGVIVPISAGLAWLWAGSRARLPEGGRAGWRYRLALLFFPLIVIWALLAQLNVELRGTDEKMYRWALHFTTSHPIKYNLGVLLLTTGRAREAISYFEDVRAAYPEDPNNLHALAIAYWQTGHPKSAIRLLEGLLKASPSYQPAIQSLRKMKSAKSDKSTRTPYLAG